LFSAFVRIGGLTDFPNADGDSSSASAINGTDPSKSMERRKAKLSRFRKDVYLFNEPKKKIKRRVLAAAVILLIIAPPFNIFLSVT
jgi:hypothetical protein